MWVYITTTTDGQKKGPYKSTSLIPLTLPTYGKVVQKFKLCKDF